jgi:hypothetical protein
MVEEGEIPVIRVESFWVDMAVIVTIEKKQ